MITNGKLTVKGTNWLLVITVILQLVIGFVLELFYLVVFNKQPNVYLLFIFPQIFAILLPALIYIKFKNVNIKKVLRIRPLKCSHIVLIILLAVAGQFLAQMANIPVMLLLSLLGDIPPSPIPAAHNINELMILIVIIGVLPAICEEILMRGVVLSGYEIRGTKAAIIISALFFGIIHCDIKNLFGPIIFGLIFGYVVYKSNSIFAGMLAHFTNNTFALIIDYLQKNYKHVFPMLQSDYFYIICMVISIIIIIPLLLLYDRITVTSRKPAISTFKLDMKAAFINTPIIILICIYIILQFFTIFEIILFNM